MTNNTKLEMVDVAILLREASNKTFNLPKAVKPNLVNHLLSSIRFKGVKDYFYNYFLEIFEIAKNFNCDNIRCFEEVEDHFVSISIAFNGDTEKLYKKIEGNKLPGFLKEKHSNRFSDIHGQLLVSLIADDTEEVKFQLKFPIGLISF